MVIVDKYNREIKDESFVRIKYFHKMDNTFIEAYYQVFFNPICGLRVVCVGVIEVLSENGVKDNVVRRTSLYYEKGDFSILHSKEDIYCLEVAKTNLQAKSSDIEVVEKQNNFIDLSFDF